MTTSDHPVLHLDDTIHQRARLGIMAILHEVKEADFSTIRSTLELTPGNLSRHLATLEEAGLVGVRKTFEQKRPRTWVKSTRKGKAAYRRELDMLQRLIARSQPEGSA